MNAALRSEVWNEMDQGKEPCRNPSIPIALEEFCSNEHAQPPKPEVPFVPDEHASETFADGAGI